MPIHDYQAPKDLLAQRVILITGAGSGIGKAAALSFAAHGASVILLGRNEQRLNAVYDEIEDSGWPQAAVIPVDLDKAGNTDYEQVAIAIEQEFGRLDGLLHNAAYLGPLTPLTSYNEQEWAHVMRVNFYAPYQLTRACLNNLMQSKDASVVFTSADVGRQGRAYWGAYGIAYAATEGMMQIWADELETHTPIRMNSIDPGPVHTHLRSRAYPGEDPSKLPEADSIMPAYLYLFGPDSKGVRGQAFMAQAADD